MEDPLNTPELLELQARFQQGGEEFITESFTGMNPDGIQWLANATQAIEQSVQGISTGQSQGEMCISEFHVLLKSTERSIQSGVSMDGGPVVSPPVNVSAVRAIVEYYLAKDGATDEAWKHLVYAIRVGHTAQKFRGKIPASAKGPSSGAGCAVFLLATIGFAFAGVLKGVSALV